MPPCTAGATGPVDIQIILIIFERACTKNDDPRKSIFRGFAGIVGIRRYQGMWFQPVRKKPGKPRMEPSGSGQTGGVFCIVSL